MGTIENDGVVQIHQRAQFGGYRRTYVLPTVWAVTGFLEKDGTKWPLRSLRLGIKREGKRATRSGARITMLRIS